MKRAIYTLSAILAISTFAAAAPKAAHSGAKLTMKQAQAKALKAAPGKVKSKELEKEKGKLIYSFDIQTANDGIHEVNIDARTGKLVENSKESPAAEAQEKQQDQQSKKK